MQLLAEGCHVVHRGHGRVCLQCACTMACINCVFINAHSSCSWGEWSSRLKVAHAPDAPLSSSVRLRVNTPLLHTRQAPLTKVVAYCIKTRMC